jgi:hypothetical protein
MVKALSWADVKREFDESLGYVRQDIRWLREHDCGLNYTVALLVGCGCEMLSAGGEDKGRRGEAIFAKLLPTSDWRLLADKLYTAIRDGLAHGFDTKQLEVDGQMIQIDICWPHSSVIEVRNVDGSVEVLVGIQPLAAALCAKIDDFEKLLQNDATARKRFRQSREYQRVTQLNRTEISAWRRLQAI